MPKSSLPAYMLRRRDHLVRRLRRDAPIRNENAINREEHNRRGLDSHIPLAPQPNHAGPHPDDEGIDDVDPQPSDHDESPDESDSEEDSIDEDDSTQEGGDDSSESDENNSVDEEDDADGQAAFDFLANFGNRPLYAQAPLTVHESVALIFKLLLNHNLTASCVKDLLTVIQLHCPREGLVKLSLYKLQRYFSFSQGPVRKMYYCSVCSQGLQTPQDICQVCERRKPVSYFVQVPLAPQLKKLFARPRFYESLQHRFTRQQPNEGWLEDIFDGMLYKEQVQEGFLSDPHNISFNYYSDGVSVFKSNNYSFWGFFLSINELPYKLRMKRENTLLAGLWFGPKKPNANLLMKSFKEDLKKIYNGILVYAAGVEQQIQVRGVMLCGVADTPARSTFLNCVQHNGFYGCPCCEIRGETLQLPRGTDTHVYRYQQPLQKRTVESMMEQAREAISRDAAYMGVKGPTALRLFMPDFVRGIGIDLMHLLMGIIRRLLSLHFDSKHSGEDYTLRPVIALVDDMLLSLKPPNFIHRMPRSVDDYCHWKASELKTWFFYYSVPILREVMSPRYFQSYLKLVTAVSYLYGTRVSLHMIERADQLLHEFLIEFQDLYGLRYCTINFHMLLHLADCVRELGPMWVYSCFPYESINGEFLRVIHGKSNVDSQVLRMHWQCLDLPRKLEHLPNGAIRDLCLRSQKHLRIGERVFQSCYVIGVYTDKDVNNALVLIGLRNSGVAFARLKSYTRLLKGTLVYIAENYSRDTLSCSSYISYRVGNDISFGRIYSFIKVLQCRCDHACNCDGEHYAIVRGERKGNYIQVAQNPHTVLNYMHESVRSLLVAAVPVCDLISSCFYLNVNGRAYLAEPVNLYDTECS